VGGLVAGAMCAQYIRRDAVSEDIVGGRSGRYWTGVSGHSTGKCSNHPDCVVNVRHLQQRARPWRYKRSCTHHLLPYSLELATI